MDTNKICIACGTENREDFTFCKNCGAKLPDIAEPKPEPAVDTSAATVQGAEQPALNADPVFYAPKQDEAALSELDELATFIGNNGYEIAQKQLNRKTQAKKASWNWPVFLFGFFLNIPFVWYFYRKMYKQGTAVLLATAAFLIAISAFAAGFVTPIFKAAAIVVESAASESYSSEYMVNSPIPEEFSDSFDEGFRQGYGEELPDEIMSEITATITPMLGQMLVCFLALALLNLVYLVFIILISVYANNTYSKHCEKKIANLKSIGNCNPIYLRNVGGTSTLAGVLSGILSYVGVSIVSTVILLSSLSPLLDILMKLPQ